MVTMGDKVIIYDIMKEDSPVDGEGELRVWIQTICVAFVDIICLNFEDISSCLVLPLFTVTTIGTAKIKKVCLLLREEGQTR